MSSNTIYPCPYKTYPPSAYWSKSVAARPFAEIDPVSPPPFLITPQMRIATAGSCFAQHIARYLSESGYNYFVTENIAQGLIPAEIVRHYNYRVFPARFANIYTSRQLLQLHQRAYGDFQPQEDVWEEAGVLLDPFRPHIQPGGFETLEIFQRDRAQHFAAVRRMFEQTNVFVFTLGLTEAWRHKSDGAVYPVCPGCGAGAFDPGKYEFHNFDYAEIITDLRQVISRMIKKNPGIRFIFTVSPVPLVATATGNHVLAATTYSKSVLRAVAGKLAAEHPRVAYFPSYEIITNPANCGAYFGSDRRTVTEEGVRAVMKLFFRHFTASPEEKTAKAPPASPLHERLPSAEQAAAGIACEEEMLEAQAARLD
jgi:hypothetical protein